MEIKRKTWPLGWTPTDDPMNGRVDGLPVFENLGFDEEGAIVPLFGTSKKSSGPLATGAFSLYGATFNLLELGGAGYPEQAKVRYVGMSNGQVLRNYGPIFKSLTDYEVSILTGGDQRTAFGFSKGWSLICSGTKKYKDNGITQLPLGVPQPNAPGVYAKYPKTLYAGVTAFTAPLGIIAATNALQAVFTAGAAHGLSVGHKVKIIGLTGNWADGNNDWIVENVPSATQFTVSLNSSSFGALTGAPIFTRIGDFSFWDATAVEGTGYFKAGDYIQVTASVQNYRSIVQTTLAQDLTAFGFVSGRDTVNDIFSMDVRLSNTSELIKFRIEFLLDAPGAPSTTPDVNNYYWYEWDARSINDLSLNVSDPNLLPYYVTKEQAEALTTAIPADEEFIGSFRNGINQWSNLQVKRGDFNRVGTSTDGWANVKAIRLITIGSNTIETTCTNLMFQGGSESNLTGVYSIIQVNAYNAGTFVDRSKPSLPSAEVKVTGSTIQVQANAAAAGSNEIWLYIAGGNLDGYYRFAVIDTNINAPAPVTVTVSEVELLLEKERLQYFLEYIPDYVISIVDDFFDRTLYFTRKGMYPSYTDNPGGWDARNEFLIASEGGEIILWARKVSNSSVLVGTTKEIYEITGDGTEIEIAPGEIRLNYFKRPLGIDKPPVGDAHCVYSGSIVYRSQDGWRIVQGTNGAPVDNQARTDLLYTTQKTFQSNLVYPVRTQDSNAVHETCHYFGNKFYFNTEQVFLGRCLMIYDLKKQYWAYHRNPTAANNPLGMFLEEDGTFFFSTEAAGDKYIREINFSGTQLDDSLNQTFKIRTVADALDHPDNRKDMFTLSVEGDFGFVAPQISLDAYYDTLASTTIGFTSDTFLGRTIRYFNISELGAPKRLRFNLTHTGPVFRFMNYSVDLDLRPTQMKYLRLKNTNFGVQGRKRLPELPFVIDTLGGITTFTPLLDNVPQAPMNVTTLEKLTQNYQFTSDVTPRDIGGIFVAVSGVFEFYNLPDPREIEVLPDSVKYKKVPATNFGIANKKRIRTIPFVIDTGGRDVVFTPIVDGVTYPSSTHNTVGRRTVFHYFQDDVFGVDYEAVLSSSFEFEFYGLLKPENVEILPVGKLLDQVGLIELSRFGKLYMLYIRVLATGTSMTYRIYKEENILAHGGVFTTTPNQDTEYTIRLPHFVTGKVFRIELQSPDVFHRWTVKVEYSVSGSDTARKRVVLK